MVSPKEYIFNLFKKLGKADAFTRELAAQIDNGEPVIKHPYKEVDRDGNEAQAYFHIKKSDRNNYFLNKFDMEVKRAGQSNVVRDTFYINDVTRRPHNDNNDPAKFFTTFTFKKGFSYLIGRPVRNEYYNKNGQSYKNWDLIDFKAPLGDGRFKRRSFHDNYGFDLEKVLKNYSIKELATPAFKESLINSLERGNLQSAKFVGNDGKETELFVSPNIRMGSLNVFVHDKEANLKKIVQLDEMDKNGWITKEFCETMREKVKEIAKKNVQLSKPVPVQKNEKNKNENPLKEDKASEKQATNNKIKIKVVAKESKPGKQRIR